MLFHYSIATKGPPGYCSVSNAYSAAQILADSGQRSQLSGQIKQVADSCGEEVPLSVSQLQHSCACVVARQGSMFQGPRAHPSGEGVHLAAALSPDQVAEAQAAVHSSVLTLQQLEPDSPKGICCAAVGGHTVPELAEEFGSPQALAAAFSRVRQLGRQTGSHYWEAQGSARALVQVVKGHVGVSDDGQPFLRGSSLEDVAASEAAVQAAVDAFGAAQPAVRLCKQFLPLSWLVGLEDTVSSGKNFWSIAHATLLAHRAPSSSEAAAARDAAVEAVQRPRVNIATANTCDGCGKAALALRRCARCGLAFYCR